MTTPEHPWPALRAPVTGHLRATRPSTRWEHSPFDRRPRALYPCYAGTLCGGRGIRTHDGCHPIAVFKTAALGHYASPPSSTDAL